MSKIFKGKVKYDFWIGIMGMDKAKFMEFCLVLEFIVFGAIYFADENIDYPVLFCLFAAMTIFCCWYHDFYKARLEKWDKKGFEILEVDDKERIVRLDHRRVIPFAEILQIIFILLVLLKRKRYYKYVKTLRLMVSAVLLLTLLLLQ